MNFQNNNRPLLNNLSLPFSQYQKNGNLQIIELDSHYHFEDFVWKNNNCLKIQLLTITHQQQQNGTFDHSQSQISIQQEFMDEHNNVMQHAINTFFLEYHQFFQIQSLTNLTPLRITPSIELLNISTIKTLLSSQYYPFINEKIQMITKLWMRPTNRKIIRFFAKIPLQDLRQQLIYFVLFLMTNYEENFFQMKDKNQNEISTLAQRLYQQILSQKSKQLMPFLTKYIKQQQYQKILNQMLYAINYSILLALNGYFYNPLSTTIDQYQYTNNNEQLSTICNTQQSCYSFNFEEDSPHH